MPREGLCLQDAAGDWEVAVGPVSITWLVPIQAWRFLLRFWPTKDVLEGCSVAEGSSTGAPEGSEVSLTGTAVMPHSLPGSYILGPAGIWGWRCLFHQKKTKLFSLKRAFVFLIQITTSLKQQGSDAL